MYSLIAILALASIASAQIFYHHTPLPLAYHRAQAQFQIPQEISLAHKSVIENAAREAQLPSDYTNKFYKNPRIASALAKESWFTSQEMPVVDREADKIPRENIYKLFKDAGYIKRK